MKNYTYIMLMGFALCIAHLSNSMENRSLEDIIWMDNIDALKNLFESNKVDKNTLMKPSMGKNDYSLIQWAAIWDARKIIHYLIDQKVDLEYKTRWSKTALDLAIDFLHTKSASILIRAGAQFNVPEMLNALNQVNQGIIISFIAQDKDAAIILSTFQAIAENASGQLTNLDKIEKIIKLYNACKTTKKNDLTVIEETFNQVRTKIPINTQELFAAIERNDLELVKLTIDYGANIKEAINKLSNPQMRQFIREAFIKRQAAINRVWKKYGLSVDIANIISKICRNEPV